MDDGPIKVALPGWPTGAERARAERRVMLVGWLGLLCAAVCATLAVTSCRRVDAAVVQVLPGEDGELVRAQARARQTVGEIVDALKAGRAGDAHFVVVAPVFNGRRSEKVWLRDVKVDGPFFEGVVAQQMWTASSMKPGDVYRVNQRAISDWMFVRDGRLMGGLTVRVMRRRMSEEDWAMVQRAMGVTEDVPAERALAPGPDNAP
jgi:uncharacterized protein YegJ (DUF2314 family)